ncbi:MAG: hypothetical protein FJX80_00755 [Bacteroidetes bacterium]|nr:hypothetical protein [Bacteroidota bacterium]
MPNRFVKYFLFLVSFLAAQRFLLNPVNAQVCIVPLVLAVVNFNNIEFRNTLMLFALFISVDNVPIGLTLTFAVLRYAIYLIALFILFKNRKYNSKYVFLYFIFIFFLSSVTFLNYADLDFGTLQRDLLIVVLAFPILCSDSDTKFGINLTVLNQLLVVYIISEVVNIFIRAKLGLYLEDYLSYNSTKSFIVLPTFYYLLKGRPKFALALLVFTTIVLVAYSTRMIVLTYYLGLILYFIQNGLLRFGRIFSIFSVLLIFYYILDVFNIDFEALKAITFFVQLFQSGDLYDKFLFLDPVRFYETKLFFERGLFELLFGSGFGSGLIDVNNVFHFVRLQDTAFSAQELTQRKFYNLHDTWIDLGLRFGLIAIISIYYFIFRSILFSKNMDLKFLGFAMLILFSCAAFSTQGLILISYIFFFATTSFKKELKYS